MTRGDGSATLAFVRRGLALAVVGIVVACGGAASRGDEIDVAAPAAVATVSPTPRASPSAMPTASATNAPRSAGAVPEAGILLVWGADDGIYRYDGATGALARVWAASTLDREMAYGAYVLGRHGGIRLLEWDGTTKDICGGSGWAAVSTRGNCVWHGAGADTAVYTDSTEGAAGAPLPRMLLPADWGATRFAWDTSGLQLAVVRHEPRTEPVRGHDTLWVMDLRHGTLRKVFDSSSATSFLSALHWSPIGTKIALLEQTSTSASAAADGANVRLWVVDLAGGEPTDLGVVLTKSAWIDWTFGERLAFVRGGGRTTWDNKEVVVLGRDGTARVAAGSAVARDARPAPSALAAIAPAWQPVYRGAKLAWIQGPAMTMEASPDYFRGVGPASQRVAVLDGTTTISCPGMVTEGVRWSADGRAVLLLCREPGVEQHALEIWYAALGGAPRALVKGLGGPGFGYYGLQPSLFEIAAWSLADR